MKKFYTGALFSLLVSTVAISVGCSVEDADDGATAGDRGNGGKADEADGEVDCEDTALDDSQVCRRGNGQFAPAVCCADELACQNNASIDDGKCRDSESGQFLPAACCDALCEGAAIINGFCRNEASGQFMLHACCADMCFDLQPAFDDEGGGDPFVEGSCGECGEESPDGCFCDDVCAEEGDCCEDFVDACPDLAEESGLGEDADEGDNSAFSCEGSCGDEAPGGGCFCDDVCAEFGDCCGDKVAQCGGDGSDAVVACEVDECEGAEVDDNFVCRKPNGEFANSACCGLDRCDNADLEETSDGFVCRDTENGQFIPMVCCDARCRDTGMDRSGVCRKGDGTFADPSCCADDCFRAQERGRGTDGVDACDGSQTPEN